MRREEAEAEREEEEEESCGISLKQGSNWSCRC
jgi:hypothetical protein